MIVIIDHKLGNFFSVLSACKYLGFKCKISNEEKDIMEASKLILPGVGNFAEGMNNLDKLNLIKLLDDRVSKKKIKILVICLGAQLLLDYSEEFLRGQGLWMD